MHEHDWELYCLTVDQSKKSSINREESVPSIPPVDAADPVTEYLKKFVDISLLDENLKLTPEERVQKMLRTIQNVAEFRKAGESLRKNAL